MRKNISPMPVLCQAPFSLFLKIFDFFLNFIFTARYCALSRTPCLWQGSCVSAPRCGFAAQTREILLCAFTHVPACGRDPACLRPAASLLRKLGDFTVRFCARPACGRDRKGRGACVFACKNTGGLCRSPGEPGFCAALRNKKPPGLFLVLFFF